VNGQIPHSQGKAFRVVTTIWLLLLTGLVVFDHAQIGHRIEAHPPDAEAPKLANLEGELAALQVIVSAIQRQPTSVRATEFEAFERAQSAQLARVETSLTDVVHVAQVASFEQQLTHLSAEVWRLRHPLPPRPQPAAHEVRPGPGEESQTAGVHPPFKILGTEQRGGEEFLTVSPHDAHSLFEVHVLRPGETDGDWKLESIEGRTAVFEVADQVLRVPIP